MSLRILAFAVSIAAIPSVCLGGPVLEQVSPFPTAYEFETDFAYATGTVVGDVTASLTAVDLAIFLNAPVNTSTSGCEASDFAGFAAGTIALMQRGSCSFELKVQNAQSAGAVGALIFNEGQPGRTDPFTIGCGTGCFIPTLFASFAVGLELSMTPGAIVHMLTELPDIQETEVAEPGAISALTLGLGGLLFAKRRRKSAAG